MLATFRSWLSAVTRRTRLERDMDDEMAFHVQSRTSHWIHQGLPPAEAARRARIEFGAAERLREECRQARGLRFVDELRLDLRYGCRSLARAPGFTFTVAALLALGIGASTAMFSLVDAALWRGLPVRDPQQLVFLERFPGRVFGGIKKGCDISYALMRLLRDRDPLLVDATTFHLLEAAAAFDGSSEPVRALRVADNFYTMLGIHPAAGRLIHEGDGLDEAVVILSHAYWQRRFAGADVVGRPIRIGAAVRTIVGVAPEQFTGPIPGRSFDVSYALSTREMQGPGGATTDPAAPSLWLVMGRLKDGVTSEQATRSLTALLRTVIAEERAVSLDSNTIDAHRIDVRPAAGGVDDLRRQFGRPLAALMALVTLVVLLTCANLANLQLARAAFRQHELVIRQAIGAGRLRLVRQMLTESLLLALVGGIAGAAVAAACLAALPALLAPAADRWAVDVALDLRALAFTAGTTLATGLLFGAGPAWRSSRAGSSSLDPRSGDRTRTASRPSQLLVIVQVALSTVLLVCAALFARSFGKLLAVDTGFSRTHVLAVALDPQLVGIEGVRLAALYEQVLERLSAVPGVVSASFERNQPLSGSQTLSQIRPASYTGPDDGVTYVEDVGPRYFETLGIRVVAGRDFRSSDRLGTPSVIAINETAARVLFPGQNPIGRRVGHPPNHAAHEVVAVVGDTRQVSLREAPVVTAYRPALQDARIRNTSLLVRTTGEPTAIADTIRQLVAQVEPGVPIMKVATLEDMAARSLITERLTATVAALFGALALIVASVGLSGLLLFRVAQRTREIGVRMALGASRRAVLRMVLGESAWTLAAGVAAGVPLAIAAARLASAMLFELTPWDPWTMSGVVAVLAGSGLLAAMWPARRAVGVDPLAALRSE